MPIFEEKRLNPSEFVPFKSHFKNQFDSVFVAFLPFFKIKEKIFSPRGQQLSQKISLKEAQNKIPILKALKKTEGNIYISENDQYPSDSEILKFGERLLWQSLVSKEGFQNFGEVYKALCTSIGAFRKSFRREDLANKLKDIIKLEKAYMPVEGRFNPLTKLDIYEAVCVLKRNKVIVVDEFYEKNKSLDLANLKEDNFVSEIGPKDYYVYSEDKSILFSMGWDDFYYLICSDKASIEKVLSKSPIEGFYCDEKTSSRWYWTEEELKQLSP